MTAFRDLHRSGLLILPNAWDGGSAALMRSLGARAIATTSAGVAWALGWPDGDALPVDRVVQAARDVVRGAGGLPVSIDMEGEYRRGQRSVEEFLKLMAVANPHVKLTFKDFSAGQRYQLQAGSIGFRPWIKLYDHQQKLLGLQLWQCSGQINGKLAVRRLCGIRAETAALPVDGISAVMLCQQRL